MNEIIEEIQEWVAKRGYRKFVAFILIFIAFNSLIWGLLEPSNINQHIAYFSYWYYGFITLSSSILFFIFIPVNILKTIDFQSLANWNTVQGNPTRTTIDDGILGSSLQFTGTAGDASDFTITGAAKTGNFLTLQYIPETGYTFYTKIKLISKKDKTKSKTVHIHFSSDIEVAVEAYRGTEWSYPIRFRILFNKWFYSTINLKKAVRKTFGTEEAKWKYKRLEGIRIRGTGSLHALHVR